MQTIATIRDQGPNLLVFDFFSILYRDLCSAIVFRLDISSYMAILLLRYTVHSWLLSSHLTSQFIIIIIFFYFMHLRVVGQLESQAQLKRSVKSFKLYIHPDVFQCRYPSRFVYSVFRRFPEKDDARRITKLCK